MKKIILIILGIGILFCIVYAVLMVNFINILSQI